MILKLHRRAEAEIREAAEWYDLREPGLGLRFIEAVRAAFETLEREPDKFAKLESIVVNEPIRRCLLRGFPYLVIYELFDDEVFVYSVAHASRRPNYWRRRKRDK